ncbi:MAG: cell division protein ZapA [Elusimicrobia bacterium]|nr:cell division protein ZapA [Elusimicrobiota bacterium]
MIYKITIQGQSYEIEIEPEMVERMQEVEDFINKELDTIASAHRKIDSYKIAIITLIDVAYRYIELKRKGALKVSGMGKEIEELNKKLEEVLK